MEYKRLGDIATYTNGYPFKPEDRGTEGLPIIRIQDLTGNAYDLGFYNRDYPKRIEINDGDVLISWSASLGVYLWDRGKALLNQHIFKVVFDKCAVDKQYFIYAVQHKLKEMESKTHGATMKHIVKKDFDETAIPFPSLEQQAETSRTLLKTADIIAMRQQQLSALDNLIKARFVEMFGDPEYNDKGWPVKKMNDLCNIGSSKRIYQEEQTMDGIPFWRISDLVAKMDTGNVESNLYIPESKYEELKGQGLVPKTGDILVTSRGTLGRCYIISPEDRFYFQDGMISWLSHYADEITPFYIQYLFDMPGFKKQIDSMQAGSTVAYLSIAMLKKLDIMLPGRELQNQFAAFVAQIDKSKSVIQKSLDETKLLFDSLMQEYFSGDIS